MSHKEAIVLPLTGGRSSQGSRSLLPNYRFSGSDDGSVNHGIF